MKTFNEYINEADGLRISDRSKREAIPNKLWNRVGAAASGVARAISGEEGLDGHLLKTASEFVAGVYSDTQQTWRNRKGVQAAKEEAAKSTVGQKGQRRDPSLVPKLIESYIYIPDEFLEHLSEEERIEIEDNLFQAIRNGSVQDHHSIKLASSILKKKAEKIMALVNSVQTPNLRLNSAFRR